LIAGTLIVSQYFGVFLSFIAGVRNWWPAGSIQQKYFNM